MEPKQTQQMYVQNIMQYNVGCWLVARFGIVAHFLQIILNPCVVCGKKVWETICFWKKQPVIAERQTFLQKQLPNSNAKPFPKEPIPY